MLPDDYQEFMLSNNGGEGFVGERYVSLAPIEELAKWNELAEVSHWIPGGVVIGTNGGGEYYGFFPLDNRRVLGIVPGIGMEPEQIWEIPLTFAEFIRQPPHSMSST